jgi:hypothetical protein
MAGELQLEARIETRQKRELGEVNESTIGLISQLSLPWSIWMKFSILLGCKEYFRLSNHV